MAKGDGSVVRFSVTGETDATPSEELKALLAPVLESKPHELAVDLSTLEVVSSAILALLSAAARQLAADGALLSVYVSPRVHEALCEWRLDSILSLHEKAPEVGPESEEVHTR